MKFFKKQREDISVKSEIVPLFPKCKGTFPTLYSNDWHGINWGLDTAFEKIDSGSEITDVEDYNAIPDMFAQVSLFESAITTTSHPLKEEFINMWKALITLILLYDELALNICKTEIDFNNLTDDDAILLHSASEYLPSDSNGKICIYLCTSSDGSNFPIALASTKAFICPIKKIKSPLPNAPSFVTYIDGVVKLHNPVPYLKDHPDYAYKLWSILSNNLAINQINGAYRALVQSFCSEIKTDKPLSLLSYNEILIESLSSTVQDIKITYDGGVVLTNDFIFNDKIFLFKPDEMIDSSNKNRYFSSCIGCYSIKAKGEDEEIFTALLPLSLDFIKKCAYKSETPTEELISDGLRFNLLMEYEKVNSSESINVSFVFLGYKFTKKYNKHNWVMPREESQEFHVPPIAVWPNKIDPKRQWKSYYVFEPTNVNYAYKNMFFKVITPAKSEPVMGNEYMEGEESFLVTKTESFPYFLYAYYKEKPVGLLIVRPSGSLPSRREKHVFIGVDFGTTNTIAYITTHNGGNEQFLPLPLTFESPSVLYVTNAFDCDTRALLFFIPQLALADNHASIVSILHKNMLARSTNSDIDWNNWLPYLNTNILFTDPKSNLLNIENLEMNLKWDISSSDRTLARLFMMQFAMICIWKALENQAGIVYWRFSYPSSLPDSGGYEQMLHLAYESAVKSTVGEFNVTQKMDNCKEFETTTENHAAGLYFQRARRVANVDIVNGFISIDIGGGSTDISIWQSTDIASVSRSCAESSIKFAGNDILAANIFRMSNDLIKDLLVQIGANISEFVEEVRQSHANEIVTFFNIALSTINNLDTNILNNSTTKPLSILIKLIEFDLSALIAYAGFLMRKLIRDEKYKLTDRGIVFALCGNGSKTKKWTSSKFDKTLASVFCNVAGIDPSTPVRFVPSNEPKNELAYGLVSGKHLIGLEALDTDKPKDFASHMHIVENNGTRNHEYKNELLGIFDSLLTALASDEHFNSGTIKFFNTECKAEFLGKIETWINGLNSSVSNLPYVGFSHTFAICLDRLNEEFRTGAIQ